MKPGSKLIPQRQVARELDVDPSTVYRWQFRGVAGEKLPVRFIGGRRYIDRDDLADFFRRVKAKKSRTQVPAIVDEQRQGEIERQLDRAGF